MATIAENLQTLKNSVSAIKQAISDKGGDVSGDISTWANTISNIQGGNIDTTDLVQFANTELKIAEVNGFLGDDDLIYGLPNSSIIESEDYDKILVTRDEIGCFIPLSQCFNNDFNNDYAI